MRSRPMAFVTIFLLLSLVVVVVVGTARPASGWLIKPMCCLCGWLCAWEDWVSGWITKRRHGWDAWMMMVVRMNSAAGEGEGGEEEEQRSRSRNRTASQDRRHILPGIDESLIQL